MDINEYMKKHGLTDAMLDEMAAPYEDGSYDDSCEAVHEGSHYDATSKKRVTVLYPASDAQKVVDIARKRGVNPSDVYRDALDYYLANQA